MAMDQMEDVDDKSMSFFEHVDELRGHIIRALLAIVSCGILAFVFSDFVIDKVLFGPKSRDFITYRLMCALNKNACIEEFTFKIINTDVTGQFIMSITIAFITGLILAFPYVLYEFWKFFRPALKPAERRKTTGIIIISSLLFMTGVLFGYFLLAPVSMYFMAGYSLSNEINNTWTLQSYISFISMLTVATGLIFELPLVMYFLAKLGLITKAFLKKYRRYAILVIVIVAAIVTPPDAGSQILVSIPLLVLYEVGVIVTGRVEKNGSQYS